MPYHTIKVGDLSSLGCSPELYPIDLSASVHFDLVARRPTDRPRMANSVAVLGQFNECHYLDHSIGQFHFVHSFDLAGRSVGDQSYSIKPRFSLFVALCCVG